MSVEHSRPSVGTTATVVARAIGTTEFADLTPPTNEDVSSIFQARIFRDSANAGDTATVTAAILFLDCHVEMDRLGSRDEFTQ